MYLSEKLSVTVVDQVLTRLRSRAVTACGPTERRSGTIQERPVWH